ncbi:MAG TPA: biopolymer transporter ExbD [Candidatus Acidoferrum sp.]|nr:biopolymer transporter ExbD [Candidatus Acidoferrum sp.]
MGFAVGSKRGVVSDPNIVPLIDVLLVLLVIFMLMPHSVGLQAQIPQACAAEGSENCSGGRQTPPVVIQVLANGSLRVNQEPVPWENLDDRLREIFKLRADRTAFIWGDASVEFAVVARVIDGMNTAGIAPIGLLTQQLGNDF